MAEPVPTLPSVLHLSHFDEYGGAARSSYRLHEGLRRLGVNSHMIVGSKSGSDPDVAEHPPTLVDRIANRIGYETGVQYAFLPSSHAIVSHPWVEGADVIQLGNIHGGWLPLTALPRLARGRRLVWCLHDMWAFTGHCGYSHGHDGWLTGCGDCPHLDAYPAIRRDATRLNWRLKRSLYERLSLDLVAPSAWLANLARRSPLVGGFPTYVVPYGIDTERFRPLDRAEARSRLGLPAEGQVVLVAGLEPRKGSELIGPALRAAEGRLGRRVRLVVAGSTTNASTPEGFDVSLLGNLDESEMALAYCASDLYLLPTLHDNLPNTMLEALACGIPVVATGVGGIPEAVSDGSNGMLCDPDGASLGLGVAGVLGDADLARRLGEAARAAAVHRFSLETQARGYLDVYAGTA